MTVAYVDTSCFVAIAFTERGAAVVRRSLGRYEQLVASNLVEAELRSVFARQGLIFDATLLDRVTWLLPQRRLAIEMERVLSADYVRGADLWHLACALWFVRSPSEITFVTLDERQRAVASALGFQT